jgi:excisionase family DNA binding protein
MALDKQTLEKDFELGQRGHPETLTARQVTGILGISRRTLHELVSDGQVEAFRIRRQLRFERSSIAHFIRVSRASF